MTFCVTPRGANFSSANLTDHELLKNIVFLTNKHIISFYLDHLLKKSDLIYHYKTKVRSHEQGTTFIAEDHKCSSPDPHNRYINVVKHRQLVIIRLTVRDKHLF